MGGGGGGRGGGWVESPCSPASTRQRCTAARVSTSVPGPGASRPVNLTVHCQGADRPGAVAHRPWERLDGANQALQTISTDLSMTAAVGAADLVHSHTWYANLAGHMAAMLYRVPHVMTMHSLEPLRPWKAEQLGGGYALSMVRARRGRIRGGGDRRIRRACGRLLSAYPSLAPDRVHVIRNASTPPSMRRTRAPTCSTGTAWIPTGQLSSSWAV